MEKKSGTRYFEYFDTDTGVRVPFRCKAEDYATALQAAKDSLAGTKPGKSSSKFKTREWKKDRIPK